MGSLPNDLSLATAEDIDAIAFAKGKEFNNIKTNQIRNVFAHINTLRTNFRTANSEKGEQGKSIIYDQVKRELIFLKPKLAYAAGRQRDVKPFQDFLFDIINKTVGSKNPKLALENFFITVESIVAYHKFHGGRDK